GPREEEERAHEEEGGREEVGAGHLWLPATRAKAATVIVASRAVISATSRSDSRPGSAASRRSAATPVVPKSWVTSRRSANVGPRATRTMPTTTVTRRNSASAARSPLIGSSGIEPLVDLGRERRGDP